MSTTEPVPDPEPTAHGPASRRRASEGWLPLFEIGHGGMSRVELAVPARRGDDRLFVRKRLPPTSQDPTLRASLLKEGRVARRLRHPNVVAIHDLAEDEAGPFLILDYVDGVSVAELVARCGERNELLPVDACAAIAADAAEGLAAAHALTDETGRPLGLVHRDVSPQNLLVGFDGRTRVTDFGIAKLDGGDTHTRTGLLKGKLPYMAPERLRFERFDHRADLFGLGVVLHELLAGRPLHAGADEAEIAQQILHAPPVDVGLVRADVPPALVELLFELLAKAPENRPASAAAVAARLRAIAADRDQFEEPSSVAGCIDALFASDRAARNARVAQALAAVRARTDPRRRLARRAVIGAGLAGMAAVGGWAFVRSRPLADYPPGFVWDRRRDWRAGPVPGTPSGNPVPDRRGRPVWSYEATTGGGALADSVPWFASPTQLLRWDDDFFGQRGVWTRDDDAPPAITVAYLAHAVGRHTPFAPVVRWRNPTGATITVELDGTWRLMNQSHGAGLAEVAVLVAGPKQPPRVAWRWSGPPPRRAEVLPRGPLRLVVSAEESVVVTLRSVGTSGHVTMLAPLTLTRA